MTAQTLEAIYENGIFRILSPRKIALTEGQTVRLTVEPKSTLSPLLQRALHVYDGLSDEDIAEVERIALARAPFFPARDVAE